MNYLAHILFSGENKDVQLGNFIGDAVKGSYDRYPERVREGIALHRRMDQYADQHPSVREAVSLLRPDFGRYSGVLTDIFFDHFLAVNFQRYTCKSLQCFARGFYWNLLRHYAILPPRIKGFLWHFIITNRLCRYASLSGIGESLAIMVKYRNLIVDPDKAVTFVKNRYGVFNDLSVIFFDSCKEYELGDMIR
ncbi:ACP phosphodiesterase [uncultured Sanguibacteroides sp.]|uniref:acyl carrier protein phosphodiesterase n=1 Tax=uncultured Sanguibacteroides sp. TaxID=1635151 RepID=UPI0025DBF16C|nr:ACP phosphodiesterase [uncultured Sanguibacteroides sp.]